MNLSKEEEKMVTQAMEFAEKKEQAYIKARKALDDAERELRRACELMDDVWDEVNAE